MEKEKPLAVDLWSVLHNWLWRLQEQPTVISPKSVRLRRRSDHVYEVCKGCENHHDGDSFCSQCEPASTPIVEIVFFHGLQLEKTNEPHVTTWLSRDKLEFWLTWLHDEFPSARILTVWYNASVKETDTEGKMDMFVVAKNLVSSLPGPSGSVGQTGCPVVLVGHCLGGLVMKEVCDKANGVVARGSDGDHQVLENFLHSVKGLFYYSTPHHGVHLPNAGSTGPLFEEMHLLWTPTGRRNEAFRDLRRKFGWRAAAVGGSRKVYLKDFQGFAFHVPEASTRYDTDAAGYYTVDAHHFDVCRPVNKACGSFVQLREFVHKCLEMGEVQLDLSSEGQVFTVGLQKKVPKILHTLGVAGGSIEPGVRAILLHGISGIGKTTLGEAVCAKIPINRRHSAEVEVGEKPTSTHICELQKQLCGTLGQQSAHIGDPGKGRQILREYLSKCKTPVLWFIDNIFAERDLRELLPKELNLPDRSHLVLTSHSSRVQLLSSPCEVYPVQELDKLEARKLFDNYAGAYPDDRKEQASDIVKMCGGLPLALKVVGSHLRDDDRQASQLAWTAVIEGLGQCRIDDGLNESDNQLSRILEWSYNLLSEKSKQVFIDICVLLRNANWDWVECLGFEESKCLKDYSLIKKMVGEDASKSIHSHRPKATIAIHDLLAALGRSKSSSNPRQRLLLEDYESLKVFSELDVQDFHTIQGLVTHVPTIGRRDRTHKLSIEMLDAMHQSLRILILDSSAVVEQVCRKIPSKLQICSIRSFERKCTFPYRDVSGLNELRVLVIKDCKVLGIGAMQLPKSLEIFELDGLGAELQAFDSDAFKKCTHLRILKICRRNFRSLPSSFSKLRELCTLHLLGIAELEELPIGLGNLVLLEELHLSSCWDLVALPDSISNLRRLKVLIVHRCDKLAAIPDNFGSLCSLIHLHLEWCNQWRKLPDSLGKLVALEELHLVHCEKLVALPDSIGGLQRLKVLLVEDCHSLANLPDAIDRLAALVRLRLSRCRKLEELPSGLGELVALEELHVWDCKKLVALPNSIGRLQRLKALHLEFCDSLGNLPDDLGRLSALVTLRLSGCIHLKELPKGLGKLVMLEELQVSRCENLVALPDSIGDLGRLKVLKVEYCASLAALPDDLDRLSSLVTLKLSPHSPLKALPTGLGKLVMLEELQVSRCENLVALPDSIGDLRRLKVLKVEYCASLAALPDDLDRLSSLVTLILSPHSPLKALPTGLGKLIALEELHLALCDSLLALPDSIGSLQSLKILEVKFARLANLPNSVGKLVALEKLYLFNCENLEALPDNIGNLQSLKVLKVYGSPRLTNLPDCLVKLSALVELTFQVCKQLEKLPSDLGKLAALEKLEFRGCAKLVALPDSIGCLQSLKGLDMTGCASLKELPSAFSNLSALEELLLMDCISLKKLPDSLGNLAALNCVQLARCSQLEKLPKSFGNPSGFSIPKGSNHQPSEHLRKVSFGSLG